MFLFFCQPSLAAASFKRGPAFTSECSWRKLGDGRRSAVIIRIKPDRWRLVRANLQRFFTSAPLDETSFCSDKPRRVWEAFPAFLELFPPLSPTLSASGLLFLQRLLLSSVRGQGCSGCWGFCVSLLFTHPPTHLRTSWNEGTFSFLIRACLGWWVMKRKGKTRI